MKKYQVDLTEAERQTLQDLISSGTAAARKLTHARILLKADQGEAGPGWTDEQMSQALEVGKATVARVRRRCVEQGLQVALARQLPSPLPHPRKHDGEQEAHLIALACSPTESGRARWTLRLLADKLVALEVVDHIAPETVRQVLKKTNASRG